MKAYCMDQNLEIEEVRFYYDLNRLGDNDTINSLGMKEGDHIDAILAQSGGKPVILIYPKKRN
jgi:hypothetical protein